MEKFLLGSPATEYNKQQALMKAAKYVSKDSTLLKLENNNLVIISHKKQNKVNKNTSHCIIAGTWQQQNKEEGLVEVGYISFSFKSLEKEIVINYVETIEKFRKQGVARQMFKLVEDFAKSKGISKISLYSMPNKTINNGQEIDINKEFYKSMNFSETGVKTIRHKQVLSEMTKLVSLNKKLVNKANFKNQKTK